ncbi:nucleotidyl transferase AbiEii/AbiGii toxin family protein [Candidatus Margulisiibacteriota bacterium]
MDIDFLAFHDNNISAIEDIFRDICTTPVIPDGLVFDQKTVKGQKIKKDADYEGIRIKCVGLLERSRIPMQIDVGFGDAVYPVPDILDYPVFLDFPAPILKGYPPESVISEKFEAMVKLGLLNSRMKDFYDIWLLIRQFDFDGLRLTESLRQTFDRRKTEFPIGKQLFVPEIYDEGSNRDPLWKAFIQKLELKNIPGHLSLVVNEIEAFLLEPIESILTGDTFNKKWVSPGPWA